MKYKVGDLLCVYGSYQQFIFITDIDKIKDIYYFYRLHNPDKIDYARCPNIEGVYRKYDGWV